MLNNTALTANDNRHDPDDFRMGETKEVNGWRIHRYADSIKVTELANAGKRGKTVGIVTVYNFRHPSPMESNALEFVMWANRGASMAKMVDVANEQSRLCRATVEVQYVKGIEVTPGGFKAIEIHTENLYLKAEYGSFVIRDVTDYHNVPTAIPAISGGKKSIPALYRWVKDNEATVKTLTFHGLLEALRAEGVKFHQYCAID